MKEIDYQDSYLGSNLNLADVHCNGKVNLRRTHISNILDFGGSCFESNIELHSTNFKILKLKVGYAHDYHITVRGTSRDDWETIVESQEEVDSIFRNGKNKK